MRNFKITVNGTVYDVTVEEVGADSAAKASAAPVQTAAPVAAPAAPAAAPAPAAASAGGNAIRSPFPGTVVAMNVKAGDAVKRGDVLCVVEAMKMENDICAPDDGTVAAVNVNTGTKVDADEILVTLN